jgi:uncharacterized membrane protein YgaE (UPF0421/DUF939 family)
MLPWIIGGVVVVLAGAVMSSIEEEEREKNKAKLNAKRREYDKRVSTQRRNNEIEKMEKLRRSYKNERKRLLQKKRRILELYNHPANRSKSKRRYSASLKKLDEEIVMVNGKIKGLKQEISQLERAK